jgi:hypothetical protein
MCEVPFNFRGRGFLSLVNANGSLTGAASPAC